MRVHTRTNGSERKRWNTKRKERERERERERQKESGVHTKVPEITFVQQKTKKKHTKKWPKAKKNAAFTAPKPRLVYTHKQQNKKQTNKTPSYLQLVRQLLEFHHVLLTQTQHSGHQMSQISAANPIKLVHEHIPVVSLFAIRIVKHSGRIHAELMGKFQSQLYSCNRTGVCHELGAQDFLFEATRGNQEIFDLLCVDRRT